MDGNAIWHWLRHAPPSPSPPPLSARRHQYMQVLAPSRTAVAYFRVEDESPEAPEKQQQQQQQRGGPALQAGDEAGGAAKPEAETGPAVVQVVAPEEGML